MIAPADAALLAAAAEEAFAENALPSFAGVPKEWEVIGTFSAVNSIAGILAVGERVYFGFLAQSIESPSQFAAVIRGTEQPIEWFEDCEALLVQHPHGLVEHGFYSIYSTLHLDTFPAAKQLATNLPAGAQIVVIGHSLGSAVATYLMADLAAEGTQDVSGLLFASPKPGDAQYALWVDRTVGHNNYAVINFLRDVVPRVPPSLPFGLGFQPLAHVEVIRPSDSTFVVPDNIVSNHGARHYAALLNGLKAGVAA